jgi:hypothetical protein
MKVKMSIFNHKNEWRSRALNMCLVFFVAFCLFGLGMMMMRVSVVQSVSASLEKTATNTISQKVALSSGYRIVAYPGEIVTFTHVITNEGLLSDTFGIEATSEHNWPVFL